MLSTTKLDQKDGFILGANTLSNPLTDYPVDRVLSTMAPVVRIKPNGVQMLLLFDNARKDLERNGWLVFIEKFEGFNLRSRSTIFTHIRWIKGQSWGHPTRIERGIPQLNHCSASQRTKMV
jgi:hypothetical protein